MAVQPGESLLPLLLACVGGPSDTGKPDSAPHTAVESGGGDTGGETDTTVDSDTERETAHSEDTHPDDTHPTDVDGDGSVVGVDCDDTNPSVHPGAVETCSGVDEDCDGRVDDDDDSLEGAPTWTRDADGDGFGGEGAPVTEACEAPEGYAGVGGDCDDADAAVHPGAAEICDDDETDEDCDRSADDADESVDPAGWVTWYADRDEDGHGDPHRSARQCDPPEGYVGDGNDCDDADPARAPDLPEVCDAGDLDEDCDGLADDLDPDGADATAAWYADTDGDRFGTGSATWACEAPAGFTGADGDCDDTRADVSPDGTEACDDADVDEDCDGLADDADAAPDGMSAWYGDGDGDGHGAGAAVEACDAPAGHVATHDDCDDTRGDVSPAGTEACDAADVDEDCDGLTDDADPDATGTTVYYRDADNDAYGDPDSTTEACERPRGWASNSLDCDDGDSGRSPSDADVCGDGVDQDCDGADDVCSLRGGDLGPPPR